ncbi:MAG: hypothetical protein ABFD64_12255 [Armatimonadota bacterium]
MSSKFREFDCSRIKAHEVGKQHRKVEIGSAASAWRAGGKITDLISSFPDILAGRDIKAAVTAISDAAHEKRPVILSIGAHVIKCGLSPVIADLIARGIITGLAMNGAGAIHDTEMALYGRTSEDVVAGLKEGKFGMGMETAQFVNSAAVAGLESKRGFGESLGERLIKSNAPGIGSSLLVAASRAEIPVTVHVGIGTDIVHMHPGADGSAIGDCSLRDFRIFAAEIEDLMQLGGVLLNVGSAVILPEVALKSFAMATNIGCNMDKVFAVNLDFIRQYRSEEQIVRRVRALGGRSVSLVGHHEIMLPLIAAAVIESQEG